MIKTLAVFASQAARNSGPVLDAVIQAAEHHGIEIQPNSWQSDAVVIWSVLWHGRMQANQAVWHHYRQQGRPVIVIDVGSLKRGITWRIGLDMPNGQGWFGHVWPRDQDRPAQLGVSLDPWHSRGDSILIALQHCRSQQLCDIDQQQWARDQVHALRQLTRRPVVIRPHPRSPDRHGPWPRDARVQWPQHRSGTYDDFDLDWRWHAIVNYNSSVAVQAAMHGVPVIVHESSLAHGVSTTLAQLESPQEPDRHTWLQQICRGEYLLPEIAQGLWLQRLDLV